MGGRYGIGGVGGGDWVCAKPDHWVFEGTGMKKGDGIKGLVGWEWHSDPARDLPGHEILAEGETKGGKDTPRPPNAATIYDGPKDNVVFNAAMVHSLDDAVGSPRRSIKRQWPEEIHKMTLACGHGKSNFL